jgi:Domain of unknown function (DUF4249)
MIALQTYLGRLRFGLLLLALPVCLAGCIRETDLNLPEEPTKLVVLGHFTPGERFRVRLSLSRSIYDANEQPLPGNATVTLASDGQFYDRLRLQSGQDEAFWESRDSAFFLRSYTLSVDLSGYSSVSATSAVPAHIRLHKINPDTSKIRIEEPAPGASRLRVPLTLSLVQSGVEKPFFAFRLRYETDAYKVVNGQLRYDNTFTKDALFRADGRTLSLLHDTPESVVLVNENFWNGGISRLNIDALLPYQPTIQKPRRILVEWRTLSEEFYRYYLSIARQGANLPLSDPDAVFNNVVDGYGNFSGYAVSVDTVVLQ